MSAHECYCGFIWTDEAILKGHEKDDLGELFRCPQPYEKWQACGLGFVPEEHRLFTILKKRYMELKKQQGIDKIQSKHKFTLERFTK